MVARNEEECSRVCVCLIGLSEVLDRASEVILNDATVVCAGVEVG